MFGSGLRLVVFVGRTLQALGIPYPVFWNACKRLVSGASPSEKIALCAGTAKRVYRLDAISPA